MRLPIIPFICAACFLLAASACRRGQEAQEYAAVDTLSAVDTVMSDTLVPEPVEEKKVALTDTEAILEAMRESPERGRYEQGILPTMASEVPEYAGRLLINEEEGFLIVDKNTMHLYRYDRYGVEQERVGIAVAKNFGSKHKRRDGRTPEGFFTIEGIYNSTEWLFTDDDGNTSPTKGQFGPRYMRLRTPVSSQIGIHGTVAPWSIGGRRSHGCIRMTNENILRFAEICKAGWPVIVSPGPKDMAVNESEGYDIPSVTVIPGRARCKPGKKISTPIEETSAPAADTARPVEEKQDTVVVKQKDEPETEPVLRQPEDDQKAPPVATPSSHETDPEPDDPMFN